MWCLLPQSGWPHIRSQLLKSKPTAREKGGGESASCSAGHLSTQNRSSDNHWLGVSLNRRVVSPTTGRVMTSQRLGGVQHVLRTVSFFILFSVFMVALSSGQQPAQRITQPIDESRLVRLSGNIHPLARAEFDRGTASSSLRLNRILLVLGRSEEQESALHKMLQDQQNPGSANYHKWLSPALFGEQFGPSDADVQTVTNWLAGRGFEVTRISKGKTIIEFNGTAGQIAQSFHTQIHQYQVEEKQNWANSSDPQIPAALAAVVKGFVSLNNFPRKFYSHSAGNYRRDVKTGHVTPYLTTSNGYYGLAPVDFATIYDSLPLLSAGNDGSGQTIAIVGETEIDPTNIANFRSAFGLGSGNTQIIVDGSDPGITSLDEELEADLDVQWSSAVAPGATVKFVTSASTEVTQGIDLSALYIVENNLAGVMSESYGGCEAGLGTGGNAFFSSLWEQAAAQGITVIVSSGDSAAAGCDPQGAVAAANGLGVNGIGSTPFNVSVGGTDYNDANNFSTYWSDTNSQVTAGTYNLPYESALSYIPEMTWNDSCADLATASSPGVCVGQSVGVFGGLVVRGGGGGPSTCATGSCTGYSKPSWQIGLTPNDSVRDTPDVSFFAAGAESSSKSFFVVCQSDLLPPGVEACVPDSNNSINFSGVGGTSASAPSFAGAVALAMQKAGSRLGNVNYLLYPVSQNSPSAFHDVTVGNISTPCGGGTLNCSSPSSIGVLVDLNSTPAYAAGPGYDLATGLGTPDITNLVDAIAAADHRSGSGTALTLNGGTATVTAAHGSSISVGITVTKASGTGTGPEGEVAIVTNAGRTIDGTGSSNLLVSSGSGQSTATWSSTLFPGGNYQVYANYSGDSSNAPSTSGNVSVNITPESSQVFAIIEECNGSSITAILTGSARVNYGGCYFLRYDVADSAATFLGMVLPVVSSKCSNGTASCPTGSISVTDNGNSLNSSMLLNPLATAEDFTTQLSGGTHSIVASYPGDPSYTASSGTITITVSPASTSISQPTSSPATPTANQSVQLVANVTTLTTGAPPSGTVTFFDNGTAMTGSLTMTGTAAHGNVGASTLAVLTTTFTTSGSHTVTAQYNGDVNYTASSVSHGLSLTVGAASQVDPTIAVPNPSTSPALAGVLVTLSTSISPTSGSGATAAPTGTVTLMDGGTALAGTVQYATSGTTLTASLPYTFSSSGSHAITAQYGGDSNYKAATSSALALTVNQPFAVSLDHITLSQTGGGSGTVTLTLAPATGFTGQVDVSCSSNSAQASCTPSSSAPNTVSVSSGSNATASLAYTVPALSAAAHKAPYGWTAISGMMVAVVLFVLPHKKRHSWMFLLLAAVIIPIAGCGGSNSGNNNHGSNPVTYTFTVNAKLHGNSSVGSTAQFKVTVN
jgi:hypothetical protein